MVCSVFLSSGSFNFCFLFVSSTRRPLFCSQLSLLNQLLAIFDPARDPVSDVNKIDGDGSGFTTNLQYFSIKKSTEMWFFENTSGGTVTVQLTGLTEPYSHWTEYGPEVSPIPVPAATARR